MVTRFCLENFEDFSKKKNFKNKKTKKNFFKSKMKIFENLQFFQDKTWSPLCCKLYKNFDGKFSILL